MKALLSYPILIFTLTVSQIGLLASCAYRVDKSQDDSEVVDSSVQKGSYGFEQVNRNVFIPRCIGCHNTKLPLIRNFAEAKAVLPKIINAVFVEKTMPPKGISKTELAVLRKWIADGSPEVVPNPSPDPSTHPRPKPSIGRPILWSQFKQQVFDSQCLNCHFTGNKDKISDYSDINVVRATIATAMYLTLVTKQMPPPPVKLTDEESDAFARWVIDGMRDDNGVPAPPPPAN